MSLTKKNAIQYSFDELRCSRCNSILPPRATFCGSCGERVEKNASLQPPTTGEITERYRLTSLVRRRASVQLSLARDTRQHHPVAVRDIDLSSLDGEAQAQAIAVLQQEYDLLRYQQIPDVMSVIDMRLHEQHLYTVAGWPVVEGDAQSALEEERAKQQLRTLHDTLQSGIGRPDETLALAWLYQLCRAVYRLHQHSIIIGDLDPSTIVLNGERYEGRPTLMVSWLPLTVRNLLPRSSVLDNASHFNAPETLLGRVEQRSDVYSLGALLYFLLTGTAPDEPTLRLQRPLRTPRELNTRVSQAVDALVMRALAIESTERFFNVSAMAKTIRQLYSKLPGANIQDLLGVNDSMMDDDAIEQPEEITVSIVPLRTRLANLYLVNRKDELFAAHEAGSDPPVDVQTVEGTLEATTDGEQAAIHRYEAQVADELQTHPGNLADEDEDEETLVQTGKELAARETGHVEALPHSPLQSWKQRLSGLFPVVMRAPTETNEVAEQAKAAQRGKPQEEQLSFFQRLQRFFLGEQQHATMAVALIETPLRVQPNQAYVIRIHLTGRDEPQAVSNRRKNAALDGLSGLTKGEVVHIEVRSALYHNYAYVVQRADVALPNAGYSAEVTIPMQPLASGPSGRRERLHIFFTDELRRPLYEKPFVVEVFVSHLVQSGREGYNVLTIPV